MVPPSGKERSQQRRRRARQSPRRNIDAQYRAALEHHQQGRFKEAISAFRHLLENYPDHAMARANLASALAREGQTTAAIGEYRVVIDAEPNNAGVWFNLGNALGAAGESDEAIKALERAIQIDARLYQAHFNLGNLLRDADRLQEAADRFRLAATLEPGLAHAHTNLGNVLRALGDEPGAIEAHRKAVAAAPASADASYNLANTFKQIGDVEQARSVARGTLNLEDGDPRAYLGLATIFIELGDNQNAERAYRKALGHAPGLTPAAEGIARLLTSQERQQEAIAILHQSLAHDGDERILLSRIGDVYHDQGDHAAALAWYEKAVAANPSDVESYNAVGVCRALLGDVPGAFAAFKEALRLAPQHARTHANVGTVYLRVGDTARACVSLNAAIKFQPDLATAHATLANALFREDRIAESIASGQRAIGADPRCTEGHLALGTAFANQGRLREAAACYQAAMDIDSRNLKAASNLHFILNYADWLNATERADKLRTLGNLWNRFAAAKTKWTNNKDPGRKLRVAYLSPDLRKHPVGYFLTPIMDSHDSQEFEILCYSSSSKPLDELSRRFRDRAAIWRDVVDIDDEALACRIREDRVDILVDLAGHTAGNRLAVLARSAAPVQATYLGYPSTTNLMAVDYMIADETVCPRRDDSLYSESVVRLPHFFLCFEPHPEAPEVAPPPLASNGFVTFGSFNHLPKITTWTVGLWAQILSKVARSRLIMKTRPFADVETRQRLVGLFAEQGIAKERLTLMGPTSLADHLSTYGKIDLALDSVPYCGGTTSCEALWMGVPLVTLRGESFCQRMGASLLHVLGLDALVTTDADAYVATAIALARDANRMAQLRNDLRPRMAASPVCDGARFTRDLENTYRNMWQRWCAQRGT